MNLTNEEIEMVLEAGLEKVAYEEGLNDYAESLEKVAGVHGVDAVELHNFLEEAGEMEKEAAEEEVKHSDAAYKRLRNLAAAGNAVGGGALGGFAGNQLLGGAKGTALGAATGAGAGALGSLAGSKAGVVAADRLANMKDGGKLKNLIREKERNLIKNRNEKAEKKKTASAYGLDEDTFEALFNAGVEALSE